MFWSFISVWLEKMLEMSSVFLNMLRLTRRMVHVHLRRLFSAAVGWLSTSDLICSLNPMILYRFSIWLFYCWEYGFDVLITIVWLSIFPLISVNRCLIYWSAPSLGLQTFTVFYFRDELICLWLWNGLLCLLLHVLAYSLFCLRWLQSLLCSFPFP